jgi:hypothetical protein
VFLALATPCAVWAFFAPVDDRALIERTFRFQPSLWSRPPTGAGWFIDVIASRPDLYGETHASIIATRVKVLAVRYLHDTRSSRGVEAITLEVAPWQAAALEQAQSFGRLRYHVWVPDDISHRRKSRVEDFLEKLEENRTSN